MKRILSILTAWLFFTSLLISSAATVCASQKGGRVLFISSYSYAWDTVQIQINGIKEGIGDDIEIDYEFMDTKRLSDDESIDRFHDYISYKLSHVEPYDAVILGDDAALNFAIRYRDELFNDTPLIFEGVNDKELATELVRDPLISGVIEELSFSNNIAFAKTLYPDATKVVSILDNSVTGNIERKSFYKNASLFPELEFSEINTSELTREEIIDAVSSIDTDTILIYIVMTEDVTGTTYTNKQSVKLVSDNSNVPVLRMVSGGIGEGLLGGNIVSMEQSGVIAADIATKIIHGTNPAVFSRLIDSPNIFCIDEAVMHKYGLSTSLIPEGAEVLNHKPSFWESSLDILIPVSIVIVLLIIVLVFVLIKFTNQRIATVRLAKSKRELEETSSKDFLTNVYNRTKLYTDLNNLLARNSICSLFIFDVDGFKSINDTYGHSAGDDVLKEIGLRLNGLCCKDFTAYRYGGDEFICILNNNFKDQIDAYARKCLELFNTDFTLADKQSITVKISLGISVCPDDTSDLIKLMEFADKALYSVKRNGKNAFKLYSDIK